MTRQNRVLPDGSIAALPARGTLTGNRGILHNDDGQLGRSRWRHQNWISCELHYKDVRRSIMAPGSWTELFFLDEAVAMSAGHRPCALCRRADYARFLIAWQTVTNAPAKAAEIDRALHRARVNPMNRLQVTYEDRLATLPDGCFIRLGGSAHLVLGERLLPFAPEGYGAGEPRPRTATVTVMTPRPLVAVLAAGYRPRLHPSAI